MVSDEALMKPNGEVWTNSNETLDENRDIAPFYVYKNNQRSSFNGGSNKSSIKINSRKLNQ